MTLRARVLGSIALLAFLPTVLVGEQPTVKVEPPATVVAKAKRSLAQIAGELKFVGLKEPVEVLRDHWGIPHICAKTRS